MKNLKVTEQENFVKRAQEVQMKVAEGKTVQEVLSELYVAGLENKTSQQGDLMSEEALAAVRAFDLDYQSAKENVDAYIDAFFEKAEKEKSLEERCAYYQMLCGVIEQAGNEMGLDAVEENMQEAEEPVVVEFTQEYEAQLKDTTKEAIKNSGILLHAICAHADELQSLCAEEDEVELLLNFGEKEMKYRAILTMLIYIDVKNGKIDGWPVDMTMEQIATVVCAELEQVQILEQVEKGSLAVDVASLVLEILGIVVLIRLTLVAMACGFMIAQSLFGIVLLVPACMLVVGLSLHLMYDALQLWEKTSKQIVKGVVVVLSVLKKGVFAISDYVKDRVLPLLKDKLAVLHLPKIQQDVQIPLEQPV